MALIMTQRIVSMVSVLDLPWSDRSLSQEAAQSVSTREALIREVSSASACPCKRQNSTTVFALKKKALVVLMTNRFTPFIPPKTSFK